ncbi:MAG: antibiotic biosynthesis monooxygenase [Acetobacteraceae bacterium]|nr:antibiotic biosynthesis monooxygenase [Acetobacteraceae bacterium]
MLVRILTMRVVPERLDDWLRFTRDVGFPGMLAQPGCRGIWRLHKAEDGMDYQVVTLWDGRADLERFRASEAMRLLSAQAAGLTVPPPAETLYDVVPDP